MGSARPQPPLWMDVPSRKRPDFAGTSGVWQKSRVESYSKRLHTRAQFIGSHAKFKVEAVAIRYCWATRTCEAFDDYRYRC